MIYLNNAATSFPKPPKLSKAIEDFLSKPYFSHGRTGIDSHSFDIADAARKNLAKLFNINNYKRISFSSGSTESLNTVIFGLNLEGKHVIATEVEHNSVIRPLKTLERSGKITLDFAKCDNIGFVNPADIESLIQPNTELIAINFCSNVTGTYQDIKTITEIAHKNNIKVLADCSQAAGNIEINASDWDIDFMAFTGHKSLFGLQGIGGLYVSEKASINALKYGGTGTKSTYLYQPEEFPVYFEAGTQNLPGILSLLEGTNFIFETGFEKIKKHKTNLVKFAISELQKNQKIKIYNSDFNSSYSNICFNVGKMAPEEVNFALDSSYDIIVRSGVHCAPLLIGPMGVDPWGTVRASPGYFTTTEEISEFVKAINEISNFIGDE